VTGLATVVLGRVPLVRRAAELLADRASIFVYLSIPASLAALLVILLRLAF
jgi:hypothetical protein